jgi:hypothetical protein
LGFKCVYPALNNDLRYLYDDKNPN